MIPGLRGGRLTRRSLLTASSALMPALARGQPQAKPALKVPPSVISQPPRQWGPLAPTQVYPDPDVLIVDPSFAPYLVRLAATPNRMPPFRLRLPGPNLATAPNNCRPMRVSCGQAGLSPAKLLGSP